VFLKNTFLKKHFFKKCLKKPVCISVLSVVASSGYEQ